jgi:hypothetical protein
MDPKLRKTQYRRISQIPIRLNKKNESKILKRDLDGASEVCGADELENLILQATIAAEETRVIPHLNQTTNCPPSA